MSRDDFMQQVAREIRLARGVGVTQELIAAALDVSAATVSNWACAKVYISAWHLEKFREFVETKRAEQDEAARLAAAQSYAAGARQTA